MKSIKTTIAGGLAGIPLIIEGIQQHDWLKIIAGVGAVLFGLFAKDHNVTGGTKAI